MDSISIPAKCPKCGNVINYTCWHRSSSNSASCPLCGWHYSRMIDYKCGKTFGDGDEVKIDGYVYNIGGGYGVVSYENHFYRKKSLNEDVSKIEGLNHNTIFYETWNEPGKPLRIRVYERKFDEPEVIKFLDNFVF